MVPWYEPAEGKPLRASSWNRTENPCSVQGVQGDKRDSMDRIGAGLGFVPFVQFPRESMDEKRQVDDVAAILDAIKPHRAGPNLYGEASLLVHFHG